MSTANQGVLCCLPQHECLEREPLWENAFRNATKLTLRPKAYTVLLGEVKLAKSSGILGVKY